MLPQVKIALLRLVVCTSLSFCLLTSCKKRGFDATSRVLVKETVSGVLDVNDVAILFPAPTDKNSGISLTDDVGAGSRVLSTELFLDALRRSGSGEVQANENESYKNENGDVLKSGILWVPKNFIPKTDDAADRIRSAEPLFARTVDNKDPKSWRIVSMRFDPCSASVERNRRTHPELREVKNFKLENCESELRFVAQPFDWQEQVFADFAMHIVYKIKSQDVAALAEDLLSFKRSCGVETYRAALDLHPCLSSASSKVRDAAFAQVRALITKHAKNLAVVAVMGSVVSKDPWAFYVLLVRNGKFEHPQIPAVTKLTPSGAGKREPFDNGRYQMLNFLFSELSERPPNFNSSFSETTIEEERLNKAVLDKFKDSDLSTDLSEQIIALGKDVVVPLPAESVTSTALSLRSSFKRAIAVLEKERNAKGVIPSSLDAVIVSQLKNSYDIVDPIKHDVFSTDCVSCHTIANNLRVLQTLALRRSIRESAGKIGRPIEDEFNVSAKKYGYNLDLPQDTTPFIANRASRDQEDSATKYITIQFGYYRDQPHASIRTVREAAYSASVLNASFFKSADKKEDQCTVKKMFSCEEGYLAIAPSDYSRGLVREFCATKHCPAMVSGQAKRIVEITLSGGDWTFRAGGKSCALPSGTKIRMSAWPSMDLMENIVEPFRNLMQPKFPIMIDGFDSCDFGGDVFGLEPEIFPPSAG